MGQTSAFVDEHLKQYVKKLPSYIKDTRDFFKKLEEFQSDKQIILLSMDVTSLYTNELNSEGLKAVCRKTKHQ